MFDSHCHLHDDRSFALAPDMIARAQQVGLRGLVLAGVDRDTWGRQDALRRQFGSPDFSIGVAYGVHPQLIPSLSPSALEEQLAALQCAARGTLEIDGNLIGKPDAIGELGLDAASDQTQQNMTSQTHAFRQQLALARDLDLPIVLHILKTHAQVLQILKQDGIPRAGGVVHSYSGSAEQCREYVQLGLCISFAGGVTREHAPKLWASLALVPEDRLLVETDAPDQTPMAHRPAHNEPAFLPAILAAVAKQRNQTVKQTAILTEQNARRLFRLPR